MKSLNKLSCTCHEVDLNLKLLEKKYIQPMLLDRIENALTTLQ